MPGELSKTDIIYEITYNPNFVPHRFSKANIKIVTIDGEKKYFMKNHENGSLYDLSEFGYDLWNLIDGRRTVKEMIEELEGMYKDLRPDFAKESLLFFAEEGVLEAVSEGEKKKRLDVVSAFMVRVRLISDSSTFVKPIHRVVRPFLKKALLWPFLVLFIITGLLFVGTFVSVFTTKENFEIMGSTIVGFFFYYFIVLAPVIAAHEIAHALALFHYGGAPREMGAGLYFFGPIFYADVTDSWTLNRYQRIMICAAGSIVELLVASFVLIAQYVWQFPAFTSHILTMVAFYSFYGLLVDLSPLLETDGYFMLCEGLRMPDLRGKSFNYIKTLVRKLTRRPAEKENETLTAKTKAVLVIYAASAVVWAVYLVYRSLTVATYMAQDTVASVLGVSSAIMLNNPVTIAAIVLSIASVLYFGMVMSGYGVMVYVGLKKALKTTLRFEEVHDRNLSVFLYLPKNVSQSLYDSLRKKMAKVAKNFTKNFRVSQNGPMCIVVLRLSRAKLAFVQVKEHFRKIEERFGTIYAGFLKNHENEVLGQVKIQNPQGTNLAALLSKMGKQATRAGIREAEGVVSEVIGKQAKTALYLLHSVYGRVWTVELPPNLLHELGGTLLPTLLVEDISATNLYDEVEDFKKRTIYGFDSLAKLACDNQSCLQEALDRPEKYQIISCFEPIKGRIIFVGRTEQIEKTLDSFGSLFVCQAWCGYLDNLLSEVNLNLLSLSNVSPSSAESVRSMKDGELSVLEKNLSSLIAHKSFVRESWRNSEKHVRDANVELGELEKRVKPTGDFEVGSFEAGLQMNAENLAHLPSQLQTFRTLSQDLFEGIEKVRKNAQKELAARKAAITKKKKRRLAFYPAFAGMSVVLGILGFWMFTDYMTIALLAASLLVQLSYWIAYLTFSRSFNRVSRYPSLAFRQAHFFAFAFTESLYEFMATANLLTPIQSASGQVRG